MALRLLLQTPPNPSSRHGLGIYPWRYAPTPSRGSPLASHLPLKAIQSRPPAKILSKSPLPEVKSQIFPSTTLQILSLAGLKAHQDDGSIPGLSWSPSYKPGSRTRPKRARLKASEQIWAETIFLSCRRWQPHARSYRRQLEAADSAGTWLWFWITMKALGKTWVEIRVVLTPMVDCVVADWKPAAAVTLLRAGIDEVDWGPNPFGWSSCDGSIQSTLRPIRVFSWATSWRMALLWARLRNSNSVGFRIWDPGDYISTIELSGAVPKDNSRHSTKHEVKKEGSTGHCTWGTTRLSCLPIVGSGLDHRKYSGFLLVDYCYSNFENNPRMLSGLVSNSVMDSYPFMPG